MLYILDEDECMLYKPCGNGATCVNTDGSYTCFCPIGWTGKNCTEGTYDTYEMSRDVIVF